jgi:prephenate dehydrogenase
VHVAFLGLGQIGGSIARAASAAGLATRVSAWSPTGKGPRAGAAHGVVAAASAAEAIRGADLIVLAAPPLACLILLDELAGPLAADIGADTVITDVASTKSAIVGRARSHGLRFVGGHPMAGRETAGYEAADPALLQGRPWVIVPPEPADPAAVARVAALAAACGARPIQLTADVHDAAVAAISHMPLVVSMALAESMVLEPDWETARQLAAGGWAGMTRLARGDTTMGVGILATNGPATAERLTAVRNVIDGWIRYLGGGDADPAALDARVRMVHDLALEASGDPNDGDPDSTESR